MEFGLHKSSFDDRDYLLRGYLEEKSLPSHFDITHKMTRVRSQGKEGACVGFAFVAGVKEYQEQIDYKKFIELSPRYIYDEARKISGHSEGTTLKAAMQVASKQGVCEEKYWPYQVPQTIPKSSIADTNASKYKIQTYARILNLIELKRGLVQFGPILIGVKVYAGMKKAKDTGVTPNPGCFERMKVLGGHALCAVGYDDFSPYYNDGHIKCKNSWGSDFGSEGYIYLSYKYIKANMLDAFSSVDVDDPKPYRVGDLPHSTKGIWI